MSIELLITLFIIFTSLILLVLISFIKSILKNKTSNMSSDEYLVALKTLEVILENYKNSVVAIKRNALKSKYNIDPNSKTNAIKQYNEETNKIQKNAAKDIVTNYLSKDLKSTLDKYFSESALLLFILTFLKD